MKNSIKRLWLLPFVVVFILSGCGGDEKSGSEADSSQETSATEEVEEDAESTTSVLPEQEETEDVTEEEIESTVTGGGEGENLSSQAPDKPASTVEAESSPAPGPVQEETEEVPAATCTLSVSCAILLEDMSVLDESQWELVPSDGMILPATTVSVEEGDSVFDVLNRALREAGVPMEFSKTPAYDSVYIEGINNLYEFDAGSLSGWTYTVNGEYPAVGCSSVLVKDGDVIVWEYSLGAY